MPSKVRLTQFLAPVAAASLVVLVLLISGAFGATRDAQQRSCAAALEVRDAIRDVLLDAQQRTRDTPAETVREHDRQQALAFYDRSLARLARVHCPT